MTDPSDLQRQLSNAQERLDVAIKALAPKHRGGEMEEYWSAHVDLLRLERELAAAQNEEYAVPLEWDAGAPCPQLFVNDLRALLAFCLRTHDPNRDGSYVNLRKPASETEESLALVGFEHCMSARFGSPNDEVFEGHPLDGKGLEAYSAQEVKNSRWIRELESINSVHRMYKAEHWQDLNHYVFWFHDSTFECVATSFSVETYQESIPEMLVRMSNRLLS